MPSIVPVSTKGWIVIPKKLRDRYNIQPGGKVMLSEAEGALKIMPCRKNRFRTLEVSSKIPSY